MPGQETFTAWLRRHAITAETLDPRAPMDDLEPLRDLIGTARVVAIGENAHHVREFYLLRHRLLRFLVERCGFTALAFEAPFTEAHMVDAWVQGGPGAVQEVAAAGAGAGGLGGCTEMYDLLAWMREHNRDTAAPLRFAGTIISSRRPALAALASYLRRADPDALPVLEQISAHAEGLHHTSIFKVLHQYTALEPAVQDAMTASISRLLGRMETMTAYQRSRGREREHATALHHLRGVWYGDHALRDFAGRGIPAGSAAADAYLAESVLRLLADGHADGRIVLAVHNCHIRKTVVTHDGAFGLFPAGYHLAQALGEDYLAVAATSGDGRTAQVRPEPGHPLGFQVLDHPQPPPTATSVESAFAAESALTIADLRAARPAVIDHENFQHMRMEHYLTDVDVFDAYDAIAYLPHTTCTDYVSAQPPPPAQRS
ncbi:erythromycin esterase family protein [Planomonospora sp. ID91781]|uniref:erythromycin esterase family protein n=1 Tax=Planomonospora sp. ID91781 TaxID=2738135 RepID=UPI0018C38915|nr:erythromycin esterase family protein [Planomonospora sp. ID91781]MBG0823262.1 erythromycin esterase family protein [Planomonospora sp. ID91781]